MILLFLMVSGTAFVNAQVRIGGDAAPNAAAVLDLNASDVINNGNLGLSLPRVSLASTTDLLNGLTPLDGTLVYNTNATLGAGLYYWVTNKWVALGGGGAAAPLNVTTELDADYTATPANDIILFTTTVSRRLTLPTTGVTVGKVFYVSDIGPYGVSLLPSSALRDTNNSFVWGGRACALIFVGGGKWQIINGLP